MTMKRIRKQYTNEGTEKRRALTRATKRLHGKEENAIREEDVKKEESKNQYGNEEGTKQVYK